MPKLLFALPLPVRKCVKVLCMGQRIPEKTASPEGKSFCTSIHFTGFNEAAERRLSVGLTVDHRHWTLWRGQLQLREQMG